MILGNEAINLLFHIFRQTLHINPKVRPVQRAAPPRVTEASPSALTHLQLIPQKGNHLVCQHNAHHPPLRIDNWQGMQIVLIKQFGQLILA